jgi:hypothetical protein
MLRSSASTSLHEGRLLMLMLMLMRVQVQHRASLAQPMPQLSCSLLLPSMLGECHSGAPYVLM